MTVAEYILIAFPAVFVILNPFMASSSFMSMTMGLDRRAQLAVAKRACVTSFLVLIIFAAAGHFIFQMFRITVEAFRIAGGIILFTVGLNMLNLKPLRIKQTEEEKEAGSLKKAEDVGIVPLGIPIMSGPGSITTVIVLMAEIKWTSKLTAMMQTAGLVISIFLSVILMYVIMVNAAKLMGRLKLTGIGVITRIMGLILTVIATQFVINGVRDLLPKLAPLVS